MCTSGASAAAAGDRRYHPLALPVAIHACVPRARFNYRPLSRVSASDDPLPVPRMRRLIRIQRDCVRGCGRRGLGLATVESALDMNIESCEGGSRAPIPWTACALDPRPSSHPPPCAFEFFSTMRTVRRLVASGWWSTDGPSRGRAERVGAAQNHPSCQRY
ncbi:hypothetical protein GY45DRAFT_881057 [Cubamyces sp. BRFM 1775]|nr:hypothetical protein GY45DRAFT_881057 [Cubamyces sp. BRFM 1775]